MKIYHKISKLMPEGQTKNKIRNLVYGLLNSVSWGSKEVILDKDRRIKGKFSNLLLIKHSDCINELQGYVKNYLPKEGDVVIDAGSFYGIFAIYAAKLVGKKGKVICFEPEETNFKLLKKNIKINKLKNVILIKKGLWNKETILKFKCHGADSRLAFFDKEEELCNQVKVTNLDKIYKDLSLQKIDFVKMDIEGAEIQAIEGAREIMKEKNIHFAIASYHVVNGEKTCIKLEQMFKKIGYSAKTEYPEHLTTYAHKKSK